MFTIVAILLAAVPLCAICLLLWANDIAGEIAAHVETERKLDATREAYLDLIGMHEQLQENYLTLLAGHAEPTGHPLPVRLDPQAIRTIINGVPNFDASFEGDDEVDLPEFYDQRASH